MQIVILVSSAITSVTLIRLLFMDFRSDLIRSRKDTADAALVIARELEAGRAVAPFQQKLAQLAIADATLPLRAAILAPQSEAIHALLSEIIGHDYNVCKVVVPSRLGYSEILLQERGFLLDTGAGIREFDDEGTFLSALQTTHVLPSGDTDSSATLRFHLKGPAQLSGLGLLVPHNLDTLVRRPALLSSLSDQADWIFLVGSTQSTISAEQRQAVQLVLDQVIGLQHVLVRPPATDPSGTPATAAEEWWRGWKVSLNLGLVRQGSDLLRQRLALLTAPDSELRHHLVEARLQRQCLTTLQLMEEELSLTQRALANRLSLGGDGLLADSAPADLRKTTETLRARLTEETDSLLKSAERETKVLLGPDGDFARELRAAATALTADDIVHTPGEVVVKLTLGDHVSLRLGETLAALGCQRLASDLALLREGLECSLRDAEKNLEKATGIRHRLALDLPDEESLRATLAAATRPEIRYRGEMPRTTLATRFATARQGIMGLMILGTLGGGIAILTGDGQAGATGIRNLLAMLMLPLLIIGFLWTYVSFRKRERLLLEKEVEKLHDGVLSELRRALQDLLREQQSALAAAAQRALRSVQTQVEAACEKVQSLRQREAEDNRRRQSEQQRTVETRLTRLRQFSQQLATLQTRLVSAQKPQQQWLSSWIERFNKTQA